MLQKKVCLLGGFGVGKTSLVRRYVQSIFSDTYLTTVGVKIEKKMVNVGAAEVALILWDIAGEDDITGIRTSYLRGAAGYFLVVDVTRGETLEISQVDTGSGNCGNRFGSFSVPSQQDGSEGGVGHPGTVRRRLEGRGTRSSPDQRQNR